MGMKKLQTYGGSLPIEEEMGILMHEVNRCTMYIKYVASQKIQYDSSATCIEKAIDRFYKVFSQTDHPSVLEEENKRLKIISGKWAAMAGSSDGKLKDAIDLLTEASTANFNSNLGARIKEFVTKTTI